MSNTSEATLAVARTKQRLAAQRPLSARPASSGVRSVDTGAAPAQQQQQDQKIAGSEQEAVSPSCFERIKSLVAALNPLRDEAEGIRDFLRDRERHAVVVQHRDGFRGWLLVVFYRLLLQLDMMLRGVS